MSDTTGSATLSGRLEAAFGRLRLARPFRRAAYEPGDRLRYEVTGVVPAVRGKLVAEIERFVGGGFAGQVYRVRVLEIETQGETLEGLEVGGVYAVKILKPPSAFARFFRNALFHLGYQAPFSAQVLPSAVRTGVLWQKLIRRAAALEMGDEGAVCDTFATFYDAELHSFGEINEWIDGRIWKFEADDLLFRRWKSRSAPGSGRNCPEYVDKKLFMARLVALLHRMGAGELARQYEWWTAKSQPNALKRLAYDDAPHRGLTAIDFRAGLVLLPFLPMSPIDFWLILRGLYRGRLVQFDRSDLERLRRYLDERAAGFADLGPAIEELFRQEAIYGGSRPDLTHHFLKPLYSRELRGSIKRGAIAGWRSLGRIDDEHAARLEAGTWTFRLLYLLSAVPLLGRVPVTLWGNAGTRRHVGLCLSSPSYLLRALRGARIETLVSWGRAGRLDAARAEGLVDRPVRFFVERLLLAWLPPTWHRFLAEPSWAWARVRGSVDFTLRFLRVPEFREEVLLDQVRLGREEGMLSEAEVRRVESQIKDPFMQKYLRCLAVHLCTVPVTQVVMVLAGAAVVAYCLVYRQLAWPESMAYGAAAAAAIQLMPISPGSITRGVFVLYLMVRERDIKNYYIAAPVSFLHVVGYLAFPLQMVTHNPALARFLAARWTRRAVHVVPVFGESGALLEHGVFDLFFNLPLSMARGFRERPIRWGLGVATVLGLLVALVWGVVRLLIG